MDSLTKNKIFLYLITGMVMIIFLFFGFTQVYKSSNNVSLLTADTIQFSRTLVVLDTITRGIFSANTQEKLPLCPESPKKKNREAMFLSYMLNSFLMKNNLMFLVMTFMGVLMQGINRPVINFRFYLNRLLRLLNWLQKRYHASTA